MAIPHLAVLIALSLDAAFRVAAYKAGGMPGIPGFGPQKQEPRPSRRRGPHGKDMDPKSQYGWSSYRYTHHDATPNPYDKQSAAIAGGDVKCEVCETIIVDVLEDLDKKRRLGKKGDQFTIYEALEAESIDEKRVESAATEMERYVWKRRTGCNKLFKDSYLAKGWSVKACTKVASHQDAQFTKEEERVPWACVDKVKELPDDTTMNTYSVQHESIHYACEATIGRHRDDISDFLAAGVASARSGITSSVEGGIGASAGDRHKFIRELANEVCRKTAKCLDRKPSENVDARAKKLEKKLDERDSNFDEKLSQIKKELETKHGKGRRGARRKNADTVEL